MNEPRVVESVTNECQSLGRAHESSSARAEQLIACLEGEIAKRDEEPAACRVAVENCEVFRARIAELEALSVTKVMLDIVPGDGDGYEVYAKSVSDIETKLGALSEENEELQFALEQLRAELAAIKAQDTVGEVVGWYRLDRPYEMTSYPSVCATWHKLGAPVAPLYAAPVSEAKAQGVVMPEPSGWVGGGLFFHDRDKALEAAAKSPCVEVYSRSQMLARRTAAPVQQVSVPDVSAMARILADRNADACNVNREDNWMIYGQDYIDDVTAMLAAAPAAPAADAGLVDMYRHLQTVTPYRFKKIQDASITDGGDVMYFHKDRFDAALLADMAAHCAAKGVV